MQAEEAPPPMISRRISISQTLDKPLGLDQAILDSIDCCASDETKKKMYSCVLVVGGGVALFQGAAEMLQQRIQTKMPPSFRRAVDRVEVICKSKYCLISNQTGVFKTLSPDPQTTTQSADMIVTGVSWVLVLFLLGTVRGQTKDVRLTSATADGFTGVVQVEVQGIWYSFCNAYWDQATDGKVVCDILFPGRTADPQPTPRNGLIDDAAFGILGCNGDEKTLNACLGKNNIGSGDLEPSCGTIERATVSCLEAKRELDLEDDLKLRAAELLVQLLKAKK